MPSQIAAVIVLCQIFYQSPSTWKVSAVLTAPVSRAVAWETITDFEAQSRFIPNIAHSAQRVVDGQIETEQVGELRFLWFRIQRQATFSVTEDPGTGFVELHAISGDFEQFDQSWRLNEKNGVTTARFESTIQPKGWVPAWLATGRIQKNVDASLRALGEEMLRRSEKSPTIGP